MTQPVSDVRSNPNDNIAFAAAVLGRSKDRIAVFKEIHRGRKTTKTATEIANATGLKRKRVVEEAVKLIHKEIIKKAKRDGEIAYTREGFFYTYRNKVLSLATNPTKLKNYPTKYNLKVTGARISVSFPKKWAHTATITIDDIDSFSRVYRAKSAAGPVNMQEAAFKRGIQTIIDEKGRFKDWGGETSDLFTNRLRFQGRRCSAAMALKGRATKGLLTPARMGKNGDQIQRLFVEDADVFLIQSGGQIAPSVVQLMATHAQVKSAYTGRKIYYGVIDGDDSARLIRAYPRAFR